MKYLVLGLTFLFSHLAIANEPVKIHAIHAESYMCMEHWDGQFEHPQVGDSLGTDCIIQQFINEDNPTFMRAYTAEGKENEDWFGYHKDVLAPCDCVIEAININPVTNTPGIMIPGRASSIIFFKTDGTRIVLAHVNNIVIKKGQKVTAGTKVATVGNNGYSRNPHIHIAAWKDDKPLQIQFDQKTLSLKDRNSSNN